MSRGDDANPTLDGYRALAATAVLVFHTLGRLQLHDKWGHVGQYTRLLGRGGVAIFFILSGFLLYRPWSQSLHGVGRWPRVGAFYIRRACRILPAYLVAVAAALFVFKLTTDRSPSTVLTHLLLLQNYRGSRYVFQGLAVTWTLVIEIAFYAALPVAAVVIQRVARVLREPLAAELAVTGSLIVVANVFRWYVQSDTAGTATLRETRFYWPIYFMDWFALGMLIAAVAVWAETTGRESPLHVLARRTWVCWSVALAVVVLLASVMRLHGGFTDPLPNSQAKELAHYPLFGFAAAFFLLPGLIVPRGAGWGRSMLASRPFVALGTVSYGIYLWHLVWIHQLDVWFSIGPATPLLPLLGGVFGLTVLTAAASYRLIEQPAMRFGRTLTRPRRHAAASAA